MSDHCVWSGANVGVGPAGWLVCPGCRARWRKPPSSWARVPTHRRRETDGDGKKAQSPPRFDGDAVSEPPTTPCPSEGTPALESISGAPLFDPADLKAAKAPERFTWWTEAADPSCKKCHGSGARPLHACGITTACSCVPTLCWSCGKVVEEERRVYARPTCYACLPPPPTLPVDQRSGSQARQREPDLFDVVDVAAEELARDGVTVSLNELNRNLAEYEEPGSYLGEIRAQYDPDHPPEEEPDR